MKLGTMCAGTIALSGWLVAQTCPEARAQGLALPSASKPSFSVAGKPAALPHSAWVKGHNSAARLIAGAEPGPGGGRRLLLGVEITLSDGWKTYWRHPGDDGGLPPTFIFEQSRNLKSATVRYPAPERMKSLGGTAVGYSKPVVFPVDIEPADASRPVEVVLMLEYGICKDICVPAEARLSLTIEPTLAAMPPDLAANLARVPQVVSGAAADKVLRSGKAVLTGAQPAIVFEMLAKDLFVVPPAGVELPVPAKAGETGGAQRFRIDLKGVEDAPKLAGKVLRLVATGPAGAFEFDWSVKPAGP